MRAEPFDKLRTALVEALQGFALRQAQGASKINRVTAAAAKPPTHVRRR